LAQYVLNEEDEMLQLAMALSLNDQQQINQAPVESQPQPSLPIQPPATLPRSIINPEAAVSSNTNQTATEATALRPLSRQNSNEISNNTTLNAPIVKPTPSSSLKVSKRSKQNPSSIQNEDENKSSVAPIVTISTDIPNQIPTPQYLLNQSLKLFHLRKTLLEKFSHRIETPTFQYYSLPGEDGSDAHTMSPQDITKNFGLKSIAFFQCILTLMADLNPKEETDKKLLDSIIHSLLNILKPLKTLSNSVADLNESLKMDTSTTSPPIFVRTPENEIILICLRTISILLSKSKYQRSGDNCNFIIQTLLGHLCQFNLIEVCLNLMKHIYFDHWKKIAKAASDSIGDAFDSQTQAAVNNANLSGLMKLSYESRYYEELAPYFVKDPLNKDSFVIPPLNLLIGESSSSTASTATGTSGTNQQTAKQASSASNNSNQTHTIDLFDNYTELLTEILIRLPYQMKKLCLGSSSSASSTIVQPSTIGGATSTANDLASLNSIQHHMNLTQITNMFEFSSWTHYLCEYLVLPQCYYLKRLIKKLLQILCGSKDKYRKFKDQHILTTCIKNLTSLCHLSSSPCPVSMLGLGATVVQATEALSAVNLIQNQSMLQVSKAITTTPTTLSPTVPKLTYLNLLKLTDHLKTMLEVAVSRTSNWQRFCVQNPSTLLYLIELALLMGVDSNGSGIDSSSVNTSGNIASASTSVIVPNITQLLLCALGGTKSSSSSSQSKANQLQQQQQTSRSSSQTQLTLLNNSSSKGQSSKSTKSSSNNLVLNDENLCSILVNSLFKNVNRETFVKFIKTYLLEAAQISMRWSLHSLLYNVYKNSSPSNQDQLFDILIQMWPYAVISFGESIFKIYFCDEFIFEIILSHYIKSNTLVPNPKNFKKVFPVFCIIVEPWY
jgi:hypothetical protein